MMAPATGFYSTPGAGFNEVRMAYVLNNDDLNKAMVCLAEGLKVYPGRTVGIIDSLVIRQSLVIKLSLVKTC
jgi:aspartate aminotransferase